MPFRYVAQYVGVKLKARALVLECERGVNRIELIQKAVRSGRLRGHVSQAPLQPHQAVSQTAPFAVLRPCGISRVGLQGGFAAGYLCPL